MLLLSLTLLINSIYLTVMNRLLFLAFILLCSCTSLNKVESTSEYNNKSNEYTYSDTDSKIRYNITNDKKNLHIKLNTSEFTTITKIIRTGLKIDFDLKGKKNESIYFQYPLAQSQRFAGRDMFQTGHDMPQKGNGLAAKFDLNKILTQISNEAVFSYNGEVEQINVSSADSDVKVSIKAVNNNEITYDLFIPINKISKNGLASLSKLSVGIVSGKYDSTSAGGNRSEGMSRGSRGSMGGMGGGSRSGMGGGRGGRGGMSGGGRGGDMGGFNKSSMNESINIWFRLSLLNVE